MERCLQPGDRRHRELQQPRARRQAPPVRCVPLEDLVEAAEEHAPLLSLLGRELRGAKVVGARQRSDPRRQGRAVVQVAPRRQDLEHVGAEAEARPTKADGALTAGVGDRVLGVAELRLQLGPRVSVQPGFVFEGVIADLVAPGDELRERAPVAVEGGVLADDEPRDPEVQRVEQVECVGHQHVEVAGKGLPAGVAVGLHVRPLIVGIQGHRGRQSHRSTESQHQPRSRAASSVGRCRSHRPMVSFTFSVPSAICAEPMRKTFGREVSHRGIRAVE